jgi:GNAT superfamily N-acetyltransferase
MSLEPLRVILPKGVVVHTRPIQPEDKELLQSALERLSEMSNFFRFHRIVRHLSDAELAYLTELDQHDHAAWGCLVEDGDRLEPAGIARYVRLEGETRAEAAVTVVDEYQGLGIGSFLLSVLSRTAAANGVDEFIGVVLAENRKMIEVFGSMGATTTVEDTMATASLPVPLPNEWAGEVADRVVAHFDESG